MKEMKKISIDKHVQVASELKKMAEAYSKLTEILNFEDFKKGEFKRFKELEYAACDVRMYLDNRLFREHPGHDIGNVYGDVGFLWWEGEFDKKGFPIKPEQD